MYVFIAKTLDSGEEKWYNYQALETRDLMRGHLREARVKGTGDAVGWLVEQKAYEEIFQKLLQNPLTKRKKSGIIIKRSKRGRGHRSDGSRAVRRKRTEASIREGVEKSLEKNFKNFWKTP